MKNKTIIVSNRLPLQISVENNDVKVSPSVGGLATGMKSVHQEGDSLWIGWSGLTEEEVNPKIQSQIDQAAKNEKCLAINLTEKELNDYYYGFSNRTIWPLFHYFMEYTKFDEQEWMGYKKVNEKFAEKILENLEDGDTVWVHDYQLLLVPGIIKKNKPKVTIGFFLHIPFPSYEVFRTLPWRESLLQGMLGADLLGFHTYDYERHFLSSVSRILRYETQFNEITLKNRLVKVDSFPMGIDYEKFEQAALEHYEKTQEQKSELQVRLDQHLETTPGSKMILSIDRLDYTKGIANRIRAFEHFLEKYPEFKEKVRLIMLAVPSRSNVPQYQKLKREIDELVGRINGKFSTVSWTPIWYFFRSMPFDNLIDLYTSCDIALLTPRRDGMNLVAKEYVATRTDLSGVLILSEMAGAAHEMNEALIINPNNYDQIADALKQAYEMPLIEQKSRNRTIQKRLKRYGIKKWSSEFIKALEATKVNHISKKAKQLDERTKTYITEQLNNATNKILFLDFDGTLVNFQDDPEKVAPDQDVYEIIEKLKNKNCDVVIISGRDKEFLNTHFGDKNITLIAEHGLWLKKKNEDWETTENVKKNWMSSIRPVIESFVDRTPGTFMEEKNYSLAWHYRKSDPELGGQRANELSNVLKDLSSNHDLSVLNGNKVIEIKNSGVNKGRAATKQLTKKYDFIFAIGDDWTDEYMFRELPDETFTVKVGLQKTDAEYYVEDTAEVKKLLKKFTE
ncbi:MULTISPECIES: bifunctional alpha,alpha-trehalose-phosphate synthase (UDP-forming)/trehalose-phosphatase [Mesonia]|uniref:Trehalose-6-phosphate synthase n=1 Tax=Mesonia oceanica TaxID=2687242 RepID=A0AC61Y6R4_9FLAO|nr:MULTISPECIES: bifunctional alpha,alpha-trehalose-phosphate synthase (UDP-forming)/trehalose-phosphatase [Mesonia]MAN28362.1 bifunctional alpha,alpha-trehalose-phosphate synthase (UDP-forming)/trehalose-phosphatase [Mesonia sp.]VVV00196.1 Trehalose-6-phosphate synthase [Mesonia oceanica]|tara:strand:+ start:5236 stop:7440 length:2205 start_codon:yes stop_codon:yes gene_type:complete